jgi:PAS domain S-box-containing protein
VNDLQATVSGPSRDQLPPQSLREANANGRLDEVKAVLVLGTELGLLAAVAASLNTQRDKSRTALAEKKLRVGEKRFRARANNTTHLAWMADGKGEVIWYNQRWIDYSGTRSIAGTTSVTGTPSVKSTERGWRKALHPDYAQRVTEKISHCFRSGEAWEDTVPIRDRNGDYRWFVSNAIPIRDRKQQVWRWFGTHTEIGVRESDELDLARMEGRYRGLLEAAPDAMVVVNPNGDIVLLNVQAEKRFGYSRDELVGQQVRNIIPEGFAERLIADGTRTAADALAQQIGTGIELVGRRKDGSEFPIEIMLSPLDSVEGILVTAAIRDISVRKAAESHLARMESRYRGLLEAAPDAMVVVNPDGEIVLLNVQAEHQFGYRRDELLGQRVKNIIPEGFAERLIADALRSAEDALAQQIGTGIELSGRRKDGTEFPIEIMLSPLESADGILVTAAIRDISVRKVAEKQLTLARDGAERGSRAKSRFLAGMSHELRTPLNGILGYAQLLRMEGGLNVAQLGRIDAMLGAGTHLLEMINCVLDLSQIEAGRFELHPVDFDPRSVALACLDLVRPAAEAKGLVLSLLVAPDVPAGLTADATRLRQVLLNLLGNAVKFTSRGSTELRVGTTENGRVLRVEVADTGPGITVEQRRHLFQDFARLDNQPGNPVEGAGLGLALSARLAILMGGHLGLIDNPGGGSVFWLELPLLPVTIIPAVIIQSATAMEHIIDDSSRNAATQLLLAASAGSLRVLVVDDMAMNREIASGFLRAAGHVVTCTEDGMTAIETARIADFDVVLMDVRMPGVDGLEATRRIRAIGGARGSVWIIALTAQVFAEQVEECRRAGMNSHLAKPFTPDALRSALAQVRGTPGEINTSIFRAADRDPQPVDAAAEGPAVLNRAVFERTASFLAPEAVASYVGELVARGEALLQGLRDPAADLAYLAEAAHTLAGSAAMFGYERLATSALLFERATVTALADAPSLATALIASIECSLSEMRGFTSGEAAPPPASLGGTMPWAPPVPYQGR